MKDVILNLFVPVFTSMATIIVLCGAMIVKPTKARCFPDWWMNGVRASDGRFGCRMKPFRDSKLRTDEDDGSPNVEIFGRIYCTNNQIPIVVNHRNVACQARH